MYNQIQHKLQMAGKEYDGLDNIDNNIVNRNYFNSFVAQIPGCSSCRELAIATKNPKYICEKCKQKQQQQQQNPKGGSKRKSKSQRRKKSKSQRRKKSIKRRH